MYVGAVITDDKWFRADELRSSSAPYRSIRGRHAALNRSRRQVLVGSHPGGAVGGVGGEGTAARSGRDALVTRG